MDTVDVNFSDCIRAAGMGLVGFVCIFIVFVGVTL